MTATLYGERARLQTYRAQIESENTPRRAAVVGGPDRLPLVYSGGAPGWTSVVSSAEYPFNATYAWDVPAGVTPSVATGKTRVLVLTLGESGMVGYDQTTDWASLTAGVGYGYPNLSGDVWKVLGSEWRAVIEPSHGFGFGPAGLFCHLLQQQLGSAYEVGLIPCAVGGTTSAGWAVGGTLYNAAIAKTLFALQLPRTVLGCILHEQGINDATQGLGVVTGWASRWTTIVSSLRAALGGTTVPLYFARHCATRPQTGGNMSDSSWAQLLAEQDAWVSSNRFAVQKPDGPWNESVEKVHLSAQGSISLASGFLQAWIDHPGSVGVP